MLLLKIFPEMRYLFVPENIVFLSFALRHKLNIYLRKIKNKLLLVTKTTLKMLKTGNIIVNSSRNLYNETRNSIRQFFFLFFF